MEIWKHGPLALKSTFDASQAVDQMNGYVGYELVGHTATAKFHKPGIPEILGIPGVRAVSQFLRCFSSLL